VAFSQQDCLCKYDQDIKDVSVIALSRMKPSAGKRHIAVGSSSSFQILSVNGVSGDGLDVSYSFDDISISLQSRNVHRRREQIEYIQWNPSK